MPIVRNYEWEKLPVWSRLKRFRKICFHQNESMDLRTEEEKLAFTVLTGTCEVKDGQETVCFLLVFLCNLYSSSPIAVHWFILLYESLPTPSQAWILLFL